MGLASGRRRDLEMWARRGGSLPKVCEKGTEGIVRMQVRQIGLEAHCQFEQTVWGRGYTGQAVSKLLCFVAVANPLEHNVLEGGDGFNV